MMKTSHVLVVLVMFIALIAGAGCSTGGDNGAAAGQNSVVYSQQAASLADCPNGGVQIDAGIDTNSNGVLDASEITSTQFVCNGTNGNNGNPGNNGVSAGVTLTAEPAGANCANGGTKISVGPDANGDGLPDMVTSVDYVCTGANGVDVSALTDATATIDSAVVSSASGSAVITINFTVRNSAGNEIEGLDQPGGSGSTNLGHLRFNFVKLIPGAATMTGGTTPNTWWAVGSSERKPSRLQNMGGGLYTYVTGTITTAGTGTANFYDPTKLTRAVLMVAPEDQGDKISTLEGLTNGIAAKYDITNGSTASKDVVPTARCLGCHGTFGDLELNPLAFHAGEGRVETFACVACHYENRGGDAGFGFGKAEIGYFVHAIHTDQTFSTSGHAYDFSGMTYPQEILNCTTCHSGGTDSDNWKNKPGLKACTSCHNPENPQFAGMTPLTSATTTHTGGQIGMIGSGLTDDTLCANCHTAAQMITNHVTDNATANNPSVPAGASNFEYVISSVTVTNNTQPVITFMIKKDGLATTFTGTGSTATTVPANAVIAGFSGSPAFLVAYADGTKSTIDFNNLGKAAAQPSSLNIAYLLVSGNTRGTISGPDGSGYYTATITDAAYGFPVGSTMRTIALQSYFTQVSPALARHTISVVKGVTGDPARREVVDAAKCANCHEIFEGHGGSRVISKDTTGTIICILCHNPNLTSSGRKANVAAMAQAEKDKLTAAGYDANNALTFPEETNNMKDMIHGIHSSGKRETIYDFVRDRNGGLYYDWSEVEFPGVLKNCETCHMPGTYDADLPAGVMMTTNIIGSAATTTTEVNTLRGTVDNTTDNVTTPVTSTCVACHDSTLAKAHMTYNGGQISVLRSSATSVETCTICHGVGRSEDVVEVHKK